MMNLVKIILFVLVNAAGFNVVPILIHVAIKIDKFPQIPVGPVQDSFSFWLFAMSMIVWGISALISVGYFFTKKTEARTLLILAPLYIPALYGTGVMLYYNFMPVM